MSKTIEFRTPEQVELYKRHEEHEKAAAELDALLNREDMKNANGVETSEEDILKILAAMGSVSRASKAFSEAVDKMPTKRAVKVEEKDIFEEVGKIYERKVVPLFVPEEDLEVFFENHKE